MSDLYATVLLSRQPLRPCGSTPWVEMTVNAVRWLRQRNIGLLSSVGMQTWELLTALASLEKLRLKLFLPATSPQQFDTQVAEVATQFDLDMDLSEFVPVLAENSLSSKEDLLLKRDTKIIDSADLVVPTSIRSGGHMDRLLQQTHGSGKVIDERFTVPYRKRSDRLSYAIDAEQLNPELDTIRDQYVIHWTRTANTAWPTERLIDYYTALVQSAGYPRSAFCTLMNILTTGRIVASSRHMPQNIPTVSLSGLSPVEVLPLMRWRARYRQMSFEPYGIGIEKGYAPAHGIRPVIYCDARKNPRSVRAQPWLLQSRGQITDWRMENEYRYQGDIDLSTIPPGKLVALCLAKDEGDIIERVTGVKSVSFFP